MNCFSFTASKDGAARGNSRHCRNYEHAQEIVDAWNARTLEQPKGYEHGLTYRLISYNGKAHTPPHERYWRGYR